MVVQFVIFTIMKEKSLISIHLQVDNMNTPSYVIKMGRTYNKHLWISANHNLLSKQITITVPAMLIQRQNGDSFQ